MESHQAKMQVWAWVKKERRKKGLVVEVEAPWASQVVLVVKNPPDNAGDVRDARSIPGSERSPGGDGVETHSSILAWRIPHRGIWWITVHEVANSWTQLKWFAMYRNTLESRAVEESSACLWSSPFRRPSTKVTWQVSQEE